jgi:pilus assembly protein CpaB
LGLIAALMARSMMVNKPVVPATASNVKAIVVAKDRILPGQELKAGHFTIASLASTSGAEQTFVNPADLNGRVAAGIILPGQAVLESLLAPKGATRGLQSLIPEGMRAITVEVDEYTGVAGLLIPGCRVDMISTIQNGESGESISRVIVQNVKVTAVGRSMATGNEPSAEAAKSVTLLVTPKEAETIGLALTVGSRPRLLLRNEGDKNLSSGQGVTLAELRGATSRKPATLEKTTPATVNPPAAPTAQSARTSHPANERTVQVIRGGVESSVTMQMKSQTSDKTVVETTETPAN